MSWAEEQPYFGMEDLLLERMERQQAIQNDLEKLTGKEFLSFILKNCDRDKLNSVVKDNQFPAYDIAEELNRVGVNPTQKQRQAITNVYIHTVIKEEVE